MQPSYLEEPPCGCAQEDSRVVVGAGHGHSGKAQGTEHRCGLQWLQDGQRVLQVGCTTIQLLWLQL